MGVELVNNCVVFPHQINWREWPKWSRVWHTEIAGGVVGLDAGGSARASQINELLLQAQVENNPTVNVPAPEIYLLKRTDEIKEVLSSSWGRKFVFDTVHGMKTELGVRS